MSVTTILLWIAAGLAGLLGLFLLSLITALVYREVALDIINGAFSIIGMPLGVAIQFFDWLRGMLDAVTQWAHEGMQEAWNRSGKFTGSIGAIDEFMAAALFVMFLVIFFADLAIAAIRIPELIGAPPLPINQQLIDYLLVGYWVSSIVGGVAVWADAWGITHFLPFYALADGLTRKILRISTLAILCLIVLGGILQGIFQWELVSNIMLPWVSAMLNVVITVVGFLTLGELGIAVAYEFLGAFVLFPSILRIIPALIAWLLNIPLAMLDMVAGVLVGLYGMISRFGYSFWNWLSEHSKTHKWRIQVPPMRNRPERPHIGERFKLIGIKI